MKFWGDTKFARRKIVEFRPVIGLMTRAHLSSDPGVQGIVTHGLELLNWLASRVRLQSALLYLCLTAGAQRGNTPAQFDNLISLTGRTRAEHETTSILHPYLCRPGCKYTNTKNSFQCPLHHKTRENPFKVPTCLITHTVVNSINRLAGLASNFFRHAQWELEDPLLQKRDFIRFRQEINMFPPGTKQKERCGTCGCGPPLGT